MCEGGGWETEKDRKNERHRTTRKRTMEGALVPVECFRASRADAEALSLSKPKPLTYTLYSNLLPFLLLLLPSPRSL